LEIAGLSGFALFAICKMLWRQKQLEWLLEAVISGAENIVLRTQFQLVLDLISESEKTLTSLGAELLKEMMRARPSVLVDLGNGAEVATKLALTQQEFMVKRRGAFLDARNTAARPLVKATLDTLDCSFAGGWHATIQFWRENADAKGPMPPLAAPLARLYDLPWNPKDPNFLRDLEKAEARGGLTLLEYLTVLLPLQWALRRRKWADLIELRVEIRIVASNDPDKVLRVEEDTLRGAAAIKIMRSFLASALPLKKVVANSDPGTDVVGQ
jgi:hypothetical protein